MLANSRQHMPIEHETRRWWLESNRQSRNSGPYVPKLQSGLHVRILNWPAMTGQASPDFIGSAGEKKRHQSRVIEQPFYGCAQWTKQQRVAALHDGRQRSILRAR